MKLVAIDKRTFFMRNYIHRLPIIFVHLICFYPSQGKKVYDYDKQSPRLIDRQEDNNSEI